MEVVPTKILKVDLPSRRVITVIAHKGRTLKEVLKPLLNKYGFNLDTIAVWSENYCICLDMPAIDAPARLTLTNVKDEGKMIKLRYIWFEKILKRNIIESKWWRKEYFVIIDPQKEYPHDVLHGQPTLDEITNRVFEELLVGKSASKYQYNEGSCKVIERVYLSNQQKEFVEG